MRAHTTILMPQELPAGAKHNETCMDTMFLFRPLSILGQAITNVSCNNTTKCIINELTNTQRDKLQDQHITATCSIDKMDVQRAGTLRHIPCVHVVYLSLLHACAVICPVSAP